MSVSGRDEHMSMREMVLENVGKKIVPKSRDGVFCENALPSHSTIFVISMSSTIV